MNSNTILTPKFFVSQKLSSNNTISRKNIELVSIKANKNDLDEHESRLADIEKRNSVETIWRKMY